MIGLFFDTETTGIKSAERPHFIPRLVQIAAILQDLETGEVFSEISLIINQYKGQTIPQATIDIHGITDAIAARFGVDPKLADVLMRALVNKADVLIAHNIEYDIDIVKDNLPMTYEITTLKQQFCTMLENVYIVQEPLDGREPGYPGMTIDPNTPFHVPSLKRTYEYYFGEPFENAHNAMADTKAMRDAFFEMKRQEWIALAVTGSYAPDPVMHSSMLDTMIAGFHNDPSTE